MPTPTYSTASTILTQVRAETGIGSSPVSTAHQDTAMLRVLNDINSEFVNYPYTIGMLGWLFLQREAMITTIANTTLNGALASGATTVVLTSGTGWDSPAGADVAAGYIKTGNSIYDFFNYETLSSNTLTVVSGLQIAHATLEETHKIYQLPTDFGKIRNVFRRSNELEYFYVDPDFTQVPRGAQFTIRVFTSTNGYSRSFMIFREDIGALEFTVRYFLQPTAISATTTSIDAPDGTPRRFIIEAMKAYVWDAIGEQNDANLARQRASAEMNKAVSEWTVSHVQPSQSLSLSW